MMINFLRVIHIMNLLILIALIVKEILALLVKWNTLVTKLLLMVAFCPILKK